MFVSQAQSLAKLQQVGAPFFNFPILWQASLSYLPPLQEFKITSHFFLSDVKSLTVNELCTIVALFILTKLTPS